MRSFICVTWLFLIAMKVQAQGIDVAVLSPTANEEFYLGEKLFFDYAPLDSSSKYIKFI